MPLAPLTFHAVSLKELFPSMEAAVEAFCRGSSCLTPRERQALFACVVSMFFHWNDFQYIALDRYLESRASAARLAYACLIAIRKMAAGPEREALKGVFQKIVASYTPIPGILCSLFGEDNRADNQVLFGSADPDAVVCGVANYDICYADIMKMVPR